MKLLDRHILTRFLMNFLLLYALLFVFAVTIDLILNLDHFVDAARGDTTNGAGVASVASGLIGVIWNFHGPQLFQFYAYLHGLVAVGAMGFTLGQMYIHRELVAILASGVSFHRIAMPFVVGMFALSLIQLANQELMLPQVAPLLLRGHGEVDQSGVDAFGVTLTADGRGDLMHAASFDPSAGVLTGLTILQRDDRGRTTRRITASGATWDSSTQEWTLQEGLATALPTADPEAGARPQAPPEPIDSYATDLSPHVLTMRRYREYVGMLSMRQIGELLQSEGVTDHRALLRHRYARFSTVLVNLLVMIVTLPSFLIREPANLLRRSVNCAAIAIGALLGAAVFMMADLRLPPMVGVFLPVLILLPIALARVSMVRT